LSPPIIKATNEGEDIPKHLLGDVGAMNTRGILNDDTVGFERLKRKMPDTGKRTDKQ